MEAEILVGKRIKSLRLEKEWTLQYLSKLSGVSHSMLGEIENNNRRPSLNTLKKIADALDVEVGLLLGDPLPGLTNPNLISAFYRAQKMSDDVQKQLVDFVSFQESRILMSRAKEREEGQDLRD